MRHRLNAADIVTASRIAFAVLVLFCSAFSAGFYAFYLLGAFTDVLDGWLARKLELRSPFGARLDTLADFIFIAAVLAKVLPALRVPRWLLVWVAVIAFIKLANLISSLAARRGIASMHTRANKVAGFSLFLLPLGAGVVSERALAIAAVAVCAAATFAAIQEWLFIRAGKEID